MAKSYQEKIKNIFAFYQLAEKLKCELRHSWLSNGAQESSAAHSWMLTLLAMILLNDLEQPVDQTRVIRMLIVHDLAEAVAGDIPAHEVSDRQTNKQATERQALAEIVRHLSPSVAQEIMELWEEFEARITPESQAAQAIDKLDAKFQHIVAGIETWDDGDYGLALGRIGTYVEYDPYLKALGEFGEQEMISQMALAKTFYRLKPEIRAQYSLSDQEND